MRIPQEAAIHLLTLDLPPMSPPKPKAQIQGALGICTEDRVLLVCIACHLQRIHAAVEKANEFGIQTYVPMHYVQKIFVGNKRILQPLLPNILFIYATRELANSLVKKTLDEPSSFVKCYLDRTLPPEANGKNPPLTIPYDAMLNFIKVTSTGSEYVRIVTAEQCHFKSGDAVRVIAGEFKGVIGRVARIAGQQRVVVNVSGLCLVATAYIPIDFIEIIKTDKGTLFMRLRYCQNGH